MGSRPLNPGMVQTSLKGINVIEVIRVKEAKQYLKEKISKTRYLRPFASYLYEFIDQAFNIR